LKLKRRLAPPNNEINEKNEMNEIRTETSIGPFRHALTGVHTPSYKGMDFTGKRLCCIEKASVFSPDA
jgi:hypothetical protein